MHLIKLISIDIKDYVGNTYAVIYAFEYFFTTKPKHLYCHVFII